MSAYGLNLLKWIGWKILSLLNHIFTIKSLFYFMKQKNFLVEVLLGPEYESVVIREMSGLPVFGGSSADAIAFLSESIADFKSRVEDKDRKEM